MPAFMVNASYNCVLAGDLQNRAVRSHGGFKLFDDFETADVSKATRNSKGHTFNTTTTTTTTTTTQRGRSSTTKNTSTTVASSSDKTFAQTSSATTCLDSFGGGAHEDTTNDRRWKRFHHEPLRLPDQFMARFVNTLMHLAEVITADVVCAFLFGRWPPRYYQRARKNRLDRSRRRRYRRFKGYAANMGRMIWDACVLLHDTLCPIQDDVSGPRYQMVSNVQLTEYPVSPSNFVDVRTSDVVATVAPTSCCALLPIVSLSPTTSAFPELPRLASSGTQVEATTTDLQSVVSPRVPLLLEAPEISPAASRHPWVPLLHTGLETALPPAMSTSLSLLWTAALPTARPSFPPSRCVPNAGDEGVMACAEMPPPAMFPPATAAPNECAVGMLNTLVTYDTAGRSVNSPLEELDGQADAADEPLPAPFFVSEKYTPESTCYMAYTTIIISYVHRFTHPTNQETPGDIPITTQTGDASDVVFPAVNARMRCKWSRACIQTTWSEYYRSSVEAVFVSSFVPDIVDMVVLNDWVKEHL